MLNPFPIQWLALFAYFILRVFVGVILYYLAYTHIRHYRELVTSTRWPLLPRHPLPIMLFIGTEILLTLMFILGWYTQIASLLLIILSIKMIVWRERFTHPSIPSRLVYVLLIGCALSLFITGAGAFAFDLPM